MGLSALLDSKSKNSVGDLSSGWRQFVLDHLDYIAFRSKTYEIEDKLMNLYRYDLNRFLKESLKRHQDIGWIVQLLNSFKNDFDFGEVKYLIVPEDNLITNLS